MNSNILIIGLPASGKTTFLAQLYNRIRKRKGVVKLGKRRDKLNIEAIKDAVRRLSRAEETHATPSDGNLELVLPITWEEKEAILVSPDYGGEQVRDIQDAMHVNIEMVNRLKESDQWILFIRPGKIFPEYDLSQKNYEARVIEKSTQDDEVVLSRQSRFIETLQAMLFAKGKGVRHQLDTPRLFIVLTCWDELETENTPMEVLMEKLPMLVDFCHANWQPEAFKVLGISAQGFRLDNQENRDKYLDDLPESFGYLVHADGSLDADLTVLIQMAFSQ